MKAAAKKCLLVLLASLVTVMSVYASNEDGLGAPEAKTTAAERGKGKARQELESPRVELERLQPPAKTPRSGKGGNAFGASSWYVPPPPPPPPKPVPPPPPTAPPMPFTFLGLYEASPKTIIMLVKGDQVYTVSTGDVIENTYRIERVAPGMIEMTYLPLNIKQSLNTGNAL